jgi:hypothetical protein
MSIQPDWATYRAEYAATFAALEHAGFPAQFTVNYAGPEGAGIFLSLERGPGRFSDIRPYMIISAQDDRLPPKRRAVMWWRVHFFIDYGLTLDDEGANWTDTALVSLVNRLYAAYCRGEV